MRHQSTVLPSFVRYALLGVLATLFLLPFYLLARNSLMTNEQVTSPNWAWVPSPPRGENFSSLFEPPTDPETKAVTGPAPILTALGNSTFIAVTTLVLQMLISSMAGYALARIPAPSPSCPRTP
jgi:multiple sugar transport system permease protein